jgi:nucleoside-diphosphate-sugar epimerase
MKIFLTGGNGMVGKNILNHELARNYDFLAPTSAEVNLQDYNQVFQYILQNKPNFIIHAAGLVGGIHANIANPVDFLVTNTDIGRNLIMASKEAKVPNLLNIASSCMYPRDATNPLVEDSILKGELEPTNEGYALAKIFATRLCEYISKENSVFNYKTIISSNLYGKYDKFSPQNSHLIPAIIKKISDAIKNNQNQVEIWGNGLARREFMYAEDVADFVYFAVENIHSLPQKCNVGISEDFSINDYYKEIAELLNFKGTFVHDETKPSGMKQKLLNSSLALQLGWKPKHSLTQGLKKTISYYQNELLS